MSDPGTKKRSALPLPISPVRKRSRDHLRNPETTLQVPNAISGTSSLGSSEKSPQVTDAVPLLNRYSKTVKQIETHLCDGPLTLKILEDVQKPLRVFQQYLTLKIKDFNEDLDYYLILHSILCQIGDFRGIVVCELIEDGKKPEQNRQWTQDRETWSHYMRDRYAATETFALLLQSAVSRPSKEQRNCEIQYAVTRLINAVKKNKIKEIQRKSVDKLSANDKKALRNEVQLLRATGKLKLEVDISKIPPKELILYLQTDEKDTQVRIEYLDHLRQNYHKCETCKLRVQALFLESKKLVTLKHSIQTMTLESLKALTAPHLDFLRKSRSDVDKLTPTFHRCKKACVDEHNQLLNPLHAKYESPKDGTGTSQIPALFPTGHVTAEDVEEHNMLYIDGVTTRTFFGLLNPPDSTDPQIVLYIDFPNVDNMSEVAAQRVFRLARLLHMGAIYSPKCEGNAAHQAVDPTLRGQMQVLGFRKDRSEFPWGLYVIPQRFKKQPDKCYDFMRDCMPEIALIINQLFLDSHANGVARAAHEFVRENNLPPFGAATNEFKKWQDGLGSNFTLSHDNFSNEPHLDGDGYPFVFSLYVFVDKTTGELITDPERIKQCLKGGFLIWPDLHLALKIVQCSGFVILFWRGTHERHCTVTSDTLDKGVIRYGTSIQVNKRLFDSVRKFNSMLNKVEKWCLSHGENEECPDLPILPTELGGMYEGESV